MKTTTDMTVATTILAQLGGKRFIAMTGSRDFVGGHDCLWFTIQGQRANKCRITLTPADTYTVEFLKFNRRTGASPIVEEHTGIYADMLQQVFKSFTGMDTTL